MEKVVFRWILLSVLFVAGFGNSASMAQTLGDQIVIGWNDLGMHCMNRNFSHLCILPPYNTVWAQAIQRGTSTTMPSLLQSGVSIEYSFADNTFSVGKTDFWSYEHLLFGVNLPDNVGLTGYGMTGVLANASTGWKADGIPITPFDDDNWTVEQPYQLAQLTLKNTNGDVLDTSQIVVPVSTEMHCEQCHSGPQGTEIAILTRHDNDNGTNLLGSQPVLCASCHADNALGTTGQPELPNFSLAMHAKHSEANVTNCYSCHPGTTTQCLRDVHSLNGMTCQNCHGTIHQMAQDLDDGREPWLEEPSCQNCHDAIYSTEPNTLYRNSRGHGGLYCTACHGSPHVTYPSREARDNLQSIRLQGSEGVIRDCYVCHRRYPTSPGPHGYMFTPSPTPTIDVPATSPVSFSILFIFLSILILIGRSRK